MGGSSNPLGALINGIGTDAMAGGDIGKGALMNASFLAGSKGGGGAGALSSLSANAVPQATPSIFDSGVNFLRQNPAASMSSMQMAGNFISPEQTAGNTIANLVNQNNMPQQQVDFASLLNPQRNTVLRPQEFSLLG